MPTRLEPYIGPRPFEREDRGLFFGRKQESRDLLSLVIAHPATLFYAQSGAGKTSLLNAELVPMLEGRGFEVLPLARVQGYIPAGSSPEKIDNVYMFNTLAGWVKARRELGHLEATTFDDYLQQVELQIDEDGFPKPRVVIFDQFEELFTSYPERWADRGAFFDQIRVALRRDRLLRVLFVMREDYIAQMDPYRRLLPDNLSVCLRLERLRRPEALEAITKPLLHTDCTFAPAVAETLVDDLLKIRIETLAGQVEDVPGEFVEPVQLQIVCQRLWRHVQRSKATIISERHLRSFGNVNQALSMFYHECLTRVVDKHQVKEQDLRDWFEKTLITPAGTRGTAYRGRHDTAGIPNRAVDMLEDLHLIRGERRAGALWYELSHDRFIRPILESNKVRSVSTSHDRRTVQLIFSSELSQLIVDTQVCKLELDERRAQVVKGSILKVLNQLSKDVGEKGIDLRGYEHDHLACLCEAGRRATEVLLPRQVRQYIAGLAAHPEDRGLDLNFQTPLQFLPLWETVYVGSSIENQPDQFLGFRYPVGRTFWTIDAPDCIQLRRGGFAAVYDDMSSSYQEVDLLWKQLAEALLRYRGMDVAEEYKDRVASIKPLNYRTWLTGHKPTKEPSYDLLHFACHHTMPDAECFDALESILSTQAAGKPRHTARSFVFLNACEAFEPPDTRSYSSADLFKSLAGAAIMPTCPIPDSFATQFAVEFYRRLLETILIDRWASIGQVLLDTRLHFLKEYNNPLGLAYGLYASSNQRIRLQD